MNELGEDFAEVLRAAAIGDRAAFARLWESAHPGLVRYLRVVCGSDADDVASETWVKAMRSLPSFSGDESSFRGWLAVIARHHLADQHRRASRRPELLQAAVDEGALQPSRDAGELAVEQLSTDEAIRLLATLPPEVAEMVALRVIVGLDVAQVAAIVDKKPGTVRVAVHRGLRTLAAQLDDHPPHPDVTH